MKSLKQFEAELAKAAMELEKQGRSASKSKQQSGDSGIKGDFVLPYSSMPKLASKAWRQSKISA